MRLMPKPASTNIPADTANAPQSLLLINLICAPHLRDDAVGAETGLTPSSVTSPNFLTLARRID